MYNVSLYSKNNSFYPKKQTSTKYVVKKKILTRKRDQTFHIMKYLSHNTLELHCIEISLFC